MKIKNKLLVSAGTIALSLGISLSINNVMIHADNQNNSSQVSSSSTDKFDMGQQTSTLKKSMTSIDNAVNKYQKDHSKKHFNKSLNKVSKKLSKLQKIDANDQGNFMAQQLNKGISSFINTINQLEKSSNANQAKQTWDNVKSHLNF